MAADYIPGADGAFDAWQINFITYDEVDFVAIDATSFVEPLEIPFDDPPDGAVRRCGAGIGVGIADLDRVIVRLGRVAPGSGHPKHRKCEGQRHRGKIGNANPSWKPSR